MPDAKHGPTGARDALPAPATPEPATREPATREPAPRSVPGTPERALEEHGLAPTAASGRYVPQRYEPSALWRSLYERLFAHIAVEPGWADEVRAASERGHVIYIGRAQSYLDFLGLDQLVKRHGLPPIAFANELGMSIFEPFGRGSRRLRGAPLLAEERGLSDTVAAGASALLFLRRPPTVAASITESKRGRAGEALEVDLVRTLVELQRKTAAPLLLLPQTFVWTKRTPNKQPTLLDVLFGPSDWPGRVRTALQFFLNYRNAIHRGGEPFDLLAFLQEHQELTDAQAADAVRYALLRRMERERTIILGPARKTGARLKDELIRSPRLGRHMRAAARDGSPTLAAVESQTRRELDRLAAAPDTNVVGLLDRMLRVVWDRIYDGLVVDSDGLARVREAARRGPLVLVPSHKSHVDYLIVSSVFYQHGLAVPLIAAGDNLAFFPLGAVFRRAGAFFIRRSFKGDRLYPHIVDAYVRKVLHEGHSVEVFVEGARSRTGKLLPPKLGILSMIVDAGLTLSRPIQFVPISIGYERVIEEGAYVHELEGGDKRAEDLGGLLRAPRVLRSRYGRLYLQFGKIFDLARLRQEAVGLAVPTGDAGQTGDAGPTGPASAAPTRDEGATAELTPPQRRALVSRIAHRITYEIDSVTLVTPAALLATTLLSHVESPSATRGVSRQELMSSAHELVEVFQRLGAPVARSISERGGALRTDTLDQAVALFLDARLLVSTEPRGAIGARFAVPDTRRLALEYYKNNVLHFFVPSALVASSLRALAWDAPMTQLRDRVRELSRLFKLEFQYRADAPFEEIFSDALGRMIEAGEVVWEADLVRRGPGSAETRVARYAQMIRTYLEAYRVALDALPGAGAPPISRKDWVKQALARGTQGLATGEVQLRESVAKPKLETALSAYHELGVVRVTGTELVACDDIDASRQTWRALLSTHLR